MFVCRPLIAHLPRIENPKAICLGAGLPQAPFIEGNMRVCVYIYIYMYTHAHLM